MRDSYQVRVFFDQNFETLKEFYYFDKSAAETSFNNLVDKIKDSGHGEVSLFYRNVFLKKSFRLS